MNRRLQGCCHDCGRKYGDEYGFPDLVVPHEVWKKISPTGDEGGLLCPSCLCRRLHDAGITCCGFFTSGPLSDTMADVDPRQPGESQNDHTDRIMQRLKETLDAWDPREAAANAVQWPRSTTEGSE